MKLEDLNWITLLVLGLASFRLTRLIVFDQITEFLRRPFFNEVEESSEDGTIDTYLVIKEKGAARWFGTLLSCYWCTGIWASIFICWLYTAHEPAGDFILLILATAGAGAAVETLIGRILGR